MAILELRREIPDLFGRVEKALGESRTNSTFNNGLFIAPEGETIYSLGYRLGILGYDSSVKLKLIYVPTNDVPNFDNPEYIKVPLTSHVQILGCNYKLYQVDGGLVGKVRFSQDSPLALDVIIRSNHLKTSPHQYEISGDRPPKARTSEELVDIVKSIGLEDKRYASDNERKFFRFEDIIHLLEWTKMNMRYGKQKGDYVESLRDKEGVCEQFSEIFERMVYVAGGFSRHFSVLTFNLPLEGWDYFSANPTPIGDHALSGVYYEGEWHVVDPTIYNTTYHNPEIPEGNENRAYSPKVRNYHVVGIGVPMMQFLDRKILEIGTPAEKENYLQKVILGKSPCPYRTVKPKVDVQSVCILE